MKNESKAMSEIHEIMEKIYEGTRIKFETAGKKIGECISI